MEFTEGLYKEYQLDRPFPTAEEIVYEEIAAIIDAQETLYARFRDGLHLNIRQQAVFKEFYEAPEGLLTYFLYGSTGSSKTWTSLCIVTDILLRYPGAHGLGVRNTYPELEDSMCVDIERVWNHYGIPFQKRTKPAPTYYLPNGSKFSLRSASKSSSSDKEKADSLGSTQFSVVYCNEVDNIPKVFFDTLPARMRQRDIVVKPLIICDCNPPSTDHWVYKFFFVEHDGEKEGANIRVFHFPVQDNEIFVGTKYISDNIERYKNYPALYKKFVEGKFGPTVKGTPVFGGIFDPNIHVSTVPLQFDRSFPILRGWDFGYVHPACVIMQDIPDKNHIYVYRTILGSNTLLNDFARYVLRICDRDFSGASFKDYCDQAGKSHKSTGRSDVEVLQEIIGHRPLSQYSEIEFGLDIIEQCLVELSKFDNKPIIQIYGRDAELLVEGLGFGYCQDTDSRAKRKRFNPVKDGTYDHIFDPFRYVLCFTREALGKKKRSRGIMPTIWRDKDDKKVWRGTHEDFKNFQTTLTGISSGKNYYRFGSGNR